MSRLRKNRWARHSCRGPALGLPGQECPGYGSTGGSDIPAAVRRGLPGQECPGYGRTGGCDIPVAVRREDPGQEYPGYGRTGGRDIPVAVRHWGFRDRNVPATEEPGWANLAVPEFDDWCAIDILNESGTLDPVAIAHASPEMLRLADQFWKSNPRKNGRWARQR